MPAPPSTISAPVLVDVLARVLVMSTIPFANMLPPTPTPPVTTSAPVVAEVDAVGTSTVSLPY